MTERALVTGVTGFVGSHLARELLASGVEVHALVREGAHLERIPDLEERVVLHVDDGRDATMREIVGAARVEVAFHLATNFVAEHQSDDVDALVADNVAFPTRLVDALASTEAVLVNVGTAWQHVDGASYRPKNLYAATKQAFEDIVRFYVLARHLGAVTVNLYDSYGPRDHRSKLLAALTGALRTGEPLAMSSGEQLVDLVHVDDIVRALVLAADLARVDASSRDAMRSFAVSSGRPLTVRELVELVGALAGRPVPVQWGARPDRAGDMVEHWDAGPPVPGWAPRIDLETGLAALLAEAGVSA